MNEYVKRMIACGIPEKTARAIFNSFVGNARALDRIIREMEKHPCTTANVEVF